MPLIHKEVIVRNPQGLHARPAAMFVQIASKYNSLVMIQKDDQKVNGKSIMGILTLGAQRNCKVILEINGEDADQAMVELENLLIKEGL